MCWKCNELSYILYDFAPKSAFVFKGSKVELFSTEQSHILGLGMLSYSIPFLACRTLLSLRLFSHIFLTETII